MGSRDHFQRISRNVNQWTETGATKSNNQMTFVVILAGHVRRDTGGNPTGCQQTRGRVMVHHVKSTPHPITPKVDRLEGPRLQARRVVSDRPTTGQRQASDRPTPATVGKLGASSEAGNGQAKRPTATGERAYQWQAKGKQWGPLWAG